MQPKALHDFAPKLFVAAGLDTDKAEAVATYLLEADLALLVEAATQGLAGYSRADAPKGTNAAVTSTVRDPAVFSGSDAFLRQTGWLADACLASPPPDKEKRVRLPVQAALAHRRKAKAEGVALYLGILEVLNAEAERLSLSPLAP